MGRILHVVLIFTFWFLNFNVFCQAEYEDFYSEKEKKQNPKERVFLGGNLGMSFGNGMAYIEISPIVGYMFTNKLSVGTGPIFQYYKSSFYNLKLNIYGGRLYSRYILFRNIFIHAEEQLTFNKYNFSTGLATSDNTNKVINDLMIGGGIRLPFGQKSSVNLVLLYNLTESQYSLNTSPIIRIDFNF